MNMTRPGSLRHRVRLESATKTADGGGGSSIVWGEVAALWVEIKPLSGRELLSAGQFSSRLTHQIVLRYWPQVLPEMRFRKGARIFQIKTVLDVDERHQWLQAQCEEREL